MSRDLRKVQNVLPNRLVVTKHLEVRQNRDLPRYRELFAKQNMVRIRTIYMRYQVVVEHWAAGRDQTFESFERRPNVITVVLISLSIFTPLLNRHTATTFHFLKCIRITSWGTIEKTFGSFLEGFVVFERQIHWNPHQNYCWCDALAR